MLRQPFIDSARRDAFIIARHMGGDGIITAVAIFASCLARLTSRVSQSARVRADIARANADRGWMLDKHESRRRFAVYQQSRAGAFSAVD